MEYPLSKKSVLVFIVHQGGRYLFEMLALDFQRQFILHLSLDEKEFKVKAYQITQWGKMLEENEVPILSLRELRSLSK